MASPLIRFAVGGPDYAYSTLWRAAARGDDVYLSPGRHVPFKISLHASGVWALATTTESGATFEGNRRAKRWTPRAALAPGVQVGPRILVPWTSQIVTPEKAAKVGRIDATQIDILANNDLSFGPIPGVDDPPASRIAAGTADRVFALVVHGQHVMIWLAADEKGSTHFADAAAKLQPVLDALVWQ